jgi:UDP-N-acetylglucosamine transferase subunit ALG13
MEALSALPAADLCVQHGPNTPPSCTLAFPYLPFTSLLDKIKDADVVVTHAGVGSIMCAIQVGHTPVVFPRLRRYGEAVDDHQSELAEALAERGTVIVARSASELAAAVEATPPRRHERTRTPSALGAAVRAAVRGEPVGHLAIPVCSRAPK